MTNEDKQEDKPKEPEKNQKEELSPEDLNLVSGGATDIFLTFNSK